MHTFHGIESEKSLLSIFNLAVDAQRVRNSRTLNVTNARVFEHKLGWTAGHIAWARNRTPQKEFGVRVLSLAKGSKRDIAVPGWAEFYGLDWAADSKSLWAAANNRRGARALLNVGFDGKVRTMMSNQNAFLEWAIPSPDSRHLAIVQDSNSSNVWLLEDF